MVLPILFSLWGGCVTVGTLTVQRKENTLMAKRDGGQVSGIAPDDSGHNEASSELLRELVAHRRQNRTQLREEWVGRISETRLLTAMTKEEIFAEATSVYDRSCFRENLFLGHRGEQARFRNAPHPFLAELRPVLPEVRH